MPLRRGNPSSKFQHPKRPAMTSQGNCAPAGDARQPCHHGNRSFLWSCPSGGRPGLRHDYAACRRAAVRVPRRFRRGRCGRSPQLVTFNGNSFDLPVLTSPALRRQQAARRAPAPGPQVSSSSSTSPIMSATSSSPSSCSSIKGASPKAGPSSSTSSSASSSAPSITSPSAVFLP